MSNSADVGQNSTSAEADAEAAKAEEEAPAASSPPSRSLAPGRRRNRLSSSSSWLMAVLAALAAAAAVSASASAAGTAPSIVVMTTLLKRRWTGNSCGSFRCAGRPFSSGSLLAGRSWRGQGGSRRWSSPSSLCFVTTARTSSSVWAPAVVVPAAATLFPSGHGLYQEPLHLHRYPEQHQRRWRRTSAEAWPQPHHRPPMMMATTVSSLSPRPRPRDDDGTPPAATASFPDDAAAALASTETQPPLSPLARAVRDQVQRVAMAAHAQAARATTTTAAAAVSPPAAPPTTDVTVVLVLSVSGGCDSVAMFHACMEWVATEVPPPPMQQQQQQLDVHVVHFHHRQRPGEADMDCHFVRDLVERANRDGCRHNSNNNNNRNSRPINVTFHVEDWNDVDVAPLSSSSLSSEAEAGRYHEKDGVTAATTTTTPADGQTAAAAFSQDRARQWRRRRLEAYTQAQVVGRVADEHAAAANAATAKAAAKAAKAEANATAGAAGRVCNNDDDGIDDGDKASERQSHPHDTEPIVVGMVLTAHHRDDSQESLVLKMLRGVHLLNLEGMEAVTNLDGNGDDDGEGGRSRGGDKGTNGNRIYLLRPWLDYSKRDLVRYLTDRGLTWREDSSNASTGKYLRNRVRLELLPLLQDMTDGAFLDRRLPAWTAQAAELRDDVLPRVRAHLDRHTVRGTTGGGAGGQAGQEYEGNEFWLEADGLQTRDAPTTPATASRLVTSQALYQWIWGQIHVQNGRRRRRAHAGQSSSSAAAAAATLEYLSYETLQRVVHQLEAYPTRLQWTLELGAGWNLVRRGNVLRVVYVDDGTAAEKAPSLSPWSWTTLKRVVPAEQIGAADCGPIEISLPPHMLCSDLSFFSTTLGHAVAILPVVAVEPNVDKSWLWFVPPWKDSPVKLRQFLRGQHIPLHLRDDVPLLFARTTASPTAGPNEPLPQDGYRLVAVRVKDRWVIHKDYCGVGDDSMTSTASVFLYPTC